MRKELSDQEAAELWRQLSQLVDKDGRNLKFEHIVSGRTGEPTGVIQCHLFPLDVEQHLFRKSSARIWTSKGRSISECLRGVLQRLENSRARWKLIAPPADEEEEEGKPDE